MNYQSVWNQYLETLGAKNSDLFKVLYATVFLPAMYALGALFTHHSLQQKVLKEWQSMKSPVPQQFIRLLPGPLSEVPGLDKKLGLVHQFNHYCNQKRCTECMVLKKVIQG